MVGIHLISDLTDDRTIGGSDLITPDGRVDSVADAPI